MTTVTLRVNVEAWVTDWRFFPSLTMAPADYRIWIARTPWGWLQRHEWRPHDRNSSTLEPWIRGCRYETIPAYFRPVDDVAAALIAD